jgi:hypothetical protein
MITDSEYKDILKRYGVEVKIYDDGVVSGEIEGEMISVWNIGNWAMMWPDIGYANGKFKDFQSTCDLYEELDGFEKAVNELVQKYKSLKIQQKMKKIEEMF